MKKILILLVMAGLAFSASAQKFYPRTYYSRPRVVVTTGLYGSLYPYPFGYFGPYPYPYGYGPVRETRLEMKIDDIKSDYRDRIWSARHDKSLSRLERKKTVHDLKHERDQTVLDAKKNYYKTRS